ncbi:hypothetical protein KIN20_006031 [Parelaphostrongylus tenuis]|uniref:Uncharacterized protein n=1 Tax=Parelaphostrongylus tenuis TaxID=148309 RepID=A0AAD5QJ23_PARTN|nr:hypothetical protein KIN20_006031 [Parelaphostrongylus tenuis]
MVTMLPQCIDVGNTVTSLCTQVMNERCNVNMPMMFIRGIPINSTSIAGTITKKIRVDHEFHHANWSRQMWQGVLNRAVRMLTSGPFASQFATAVAVVN